MTNKSGDEEIDWRGSGAEKRRRERQRKGYITYGKK